MKNSVLNRIGKCFIDAWKPALKAAFWLLKITIPVSFLVTLLNFFGVIEWVAKILYPAFKLVGLPGESGLVFITSCFLNIYSAIAVINSLSFDMREITILALMCLISHNLITETIIQKKAGSSAWKMVVLRLSGSVVVAIILNFLLPSSKHSSII